MATGNGGIRIEHGQIEVTLGPLVVGESVLLDPDVALGLFFNLSDLTPEELDALRACIAKMCHKVSFAALAQSHRKQGPLQEEEEEPPEE